VTAESWQILIPTIRKDGSQLIISFNPQLETDDTWQRFVVNSPPNATVLKVGIEDNPWAPQALLDEMAYCKEHDPDAYQNIWLGFPRAALEGAVYADEMRKLREDGRITRIEYDPLVPVHCFYDMGWRDMTVILLAQKCAGEYRIIDYIEGHQKSIRDYLTLLQAKEYVYGTHYVPHDAASKSLQTGRSIEQLMRQAGRTVQVVPRLPLQAGINATRVLFPKIWFDQIKCSPLLNHLRHYSYDMQHLGKPIPKHDEHSHAADALRILALSLGDPKPVPKIIDRHLEPRPTGWMA
jgi:phage terminase large subunit